MDQIDIIIIVILVILILIYSVQYLYFKKTNPDYQILQKHKPNTLELQELISNKSPSVITGEIEDWFIFNKNDQIDEKKLTKEILKENTNKFHHSLSIAKKLNITNLKTKNYKAITKEKNSRHFIALLDGEISVFLFNPNNNIKNFENKKFKEKSKEFKNLNYIEVKLYKEQILYIPIQWGYSYKCLKDSKILDINSESIFTLPIKNII